MQLLILSLVSLYKCYLRLSAMQTFLGIPSLVEMRFNLAMGDNSLTDYIMLCRADTRGFENMQSDTWEVIPPKIFKLNGAKRCNRKPLAFWNFRKGLAARKLVRNICFDCAGPRDFAVPAASMVRLIFTAPATYIIVRPGLSSLFDRGHRVPQNQNPFDQMVLDDLADGSPKKRHFYVVLAADAGDQKL